jgi:protein phosphatase
MSESSIPVFKEMLSQYLQSMQCDVSHVASGQMQLSLPTFEVPQVVNLCTEIREIFARESLMLDLTGPVTVVGDLHGHILDLYRVLQSHGLPNSTKYLFLGDFVDRGDFSFELVTLVFLLKVLFRDMVFIIRGNHEFEDVCATGGFGQELNQLFRDTIVFYSFINAFSMIPIACLIERNVLAVHGGIGPDLTSIQDLRAIPRPISAFDDSVLDTVLWSDPCEDIDFYERSQRGTGYLFGPSAFRAFVESNSLRAVVRGHECVAEGCREQFSGRLFTVFSASNYCGSSGNKAGVLVVRRNFETEVHTYPPLPRLPRSAALFPGARKPEADVGPRRSMPPKMPPERIGGVVSVSVLTPVGAKMKITQPTDGALRKKQSGNMRSQRLRGLS